MKSSSRANFRYLELDNGVARGRSWLWNAGSQGGEGKVYWPPNNRGSGGDLVMDGYCLQSALVNKESNIKCCLVDQQGNGR